jgi:multicomponent Na+:H+ antiporter subunit F
VIHSGSEILDFALMLTFAILSISLILAMIRLIVGPSLPDRVVALDLIAYIVITFIAAYSIATGVSDFIDAAIVVALIAFLGTVAFARYVQQSADKEKGDNI